MTTYDGISEANLYRSREETLYGDTVAKLVFKAGKYEDALKKKIVVTPPEPIAVSEDFDGVNLWVYGDQYWGKPKGVQVSVQVKDAAGKEHAIEMHSREQPFVFWSGWYLWHRTLPAKVKAPAQVLSLTFHDFSGASPNTVYFDNLECYAIDRSPIASNVPAWKDCPFPTTPDTILPSLATKTAFRNAVRREGDSVILAYEGDEPITYRYTPRTGTLSDIEATAGSGAAFQPAANGGWVIEQNGRDLPPSSAEAIRTLQDMAIDGNTVRTTWSYKVGTATFTTRLDLTIKQKSLVVDATADTTRVKAFRCGMARGVKDPILTKVPYIVLRRSIHASEDPAILYSEGRFLSCFMDWYNSDASELFGETKIEGDTAMLNGGAAYLPKTDGQRNAPRERLFITLSKDFTETLPNIPNPPNKWLETTKTAVWATRSWYDTMPYPTTSTRNTPFTNRCASTASATSISATTPTSTACIRPSGAASP